MGLSLESFWLLLAGVLVVTEVFTGSFYLLMLGLGALMGALAAHLEATQAVQFAVAGLVGCSAMAALYQWRKVRGSTGRSKAADHLDVGQTVQVDDWHGQVSTRVQYRGTSWMAESLDAQPQPGLHRIEAVDGMVLKIRRC